MFHDSLRRLSLTLLALASVSLIACPAGRSSGGDDDDSSPEELPNLPNDNTNINVNVNVSVTMAGSGSGNNTGNNQQGDQSSYDGGTESDPGVLYVANDSGLDVGELYITECGSEDWSGNQLGAYVLPDGWYFVLMGLPVGCYDLVAYDDGLDYAWYFPAAELTEADPEFTLILLEPEEDTGDDDDAADDDDDAVDDDDAADDDDDAVDDDDDVMDDDDDMGELVVWNKGKLDLDYVAAFDTSTEQEYYLCEYLPVGNDCSADLPAGEYWLDAGNKSYSCFLSEVYVTIAPNDTYDFYVTPSSLECWE